MFTRRGSSRRLVLYDDDDDERTDEREEEIGNLSLTKEKILRWIISLSSRWWCCCFSNGCVYASPCCMRVCDSCEQWINQLSIQGECLLIPFMRTPHATTLSRRTMASMSRASP